MLAGLESVAIIGGMSEAVTPPIRAGPIPTGWPTSPHEGEKPHWPLTLDLLQFDILPGTYSEVAAKLLKN